MIDLHQNLANISKKIAALQGVKNDSLLSASLCLMQDNTCAKLLLAISEYDAETLVKELTRTKQPLLAAKIEVLLCYRRELARLTEMNLRTLTGLTRDELADLQRFVIAKDKSSGFANRKQLVEVLSKMVVEFQEAECSDGHFADVMKKRKVP